MNVVDNTLATEYKAIHTSKTYGVSGNTFCLAIQAVIAELRSKSILDYGCGQTTLHQELNLSEATYYRYDPGIPEFSRLPVEPVDKADLLINTDVLEHIPEAQLYVVLSHIASISRYVFFNIATRLAKEFLPNGQNAHCTIKSPEQWKALLRQYFPDIETVFVRPGHSVLFLTWNSLAKDVVKAVTETQILKKRLMKAKKTVPEKIKTELARVKRRLSKCLFW